MNNNNSGEESCSARFYQRKSKKTQWYVVLGTFVIFGFFGAISNLNDPLLSFFVIGFIAGGVVWGLATESGVKFVKTMGYDIADNQQQQQSFGSGGKEEFIVCQDCGLKNPKSNNYCHDCEEPLSTQEVKDGQ